MHLESCNLIVDYNRVVVVSFATWHAVLDCAVPLVKHTSSLAFLKASVQRAEYAIIEHSRVLCMVKIYIC